MLFNDAHHGWNRQAARLGMLLELALKVCDHAQESIIPVALEVKEECQ